MSDSDSDVEGQTNEENNRVKNIIRQSSSKENTDKQQNEVVSESHNPELEKIVKEAFNEILNRQQKEVAAVQKSMNTVLQQLSQVCGQEDSIIKRTIQQ
eukprot:TRINITY_DN12666_c1_g1_i1.p1 TRINITY_DN12666_c1_g1~~TRINITY_DN12666_c1_g1_i1.p1  ORF type:complete len:111 (-),score=13.65 TRINITY_DN12666_c1_g1_i1:12-308(-)